jgi:hypothetical protein
MEIFPQLPRSITDSPHSTVESFPPYSPITMKESFPPSNQIKARTPHHQPCRSLPPCLLPEIIWSQLKREATGPTRPHCNLPSRAAIRSAPPHPPHPPHAPCLFACLPLCWRRALTAMSTPHPPLKIPRFYCPLSTEETGRQ